MLNLLTAAQERLKKITFDLQQYKKDHPTLNTEKETAEETETYSKYEKDIEGTIGEIETLSNRINVAKARDQKQAQVDTFLNTPLNPPNLYGQSFDARKLGAGLDQSEFAKEQFKAFLAVLRDGFRNPQQAAEIYARESQLNGNQNIEVFVKWNPEQQTRPDVPKEKRALVLADTSLGGAFVPETTYGEIVRNAVISTPLLSRIRRVPVTGPQLPLMKIQPPTGDDLGVYPSQYVGDQWKQEADVTAVHLATKQDQPLTARDKIVVHKYKPKPIFASGDLLMDAPAFESEFNRVINQTYGIDMLKNVILGTGVDRPMGVFVDPDINPAKHVNSGASGAFTWQGLMDLIYGLPEGWAEDPSIALALRRASYGKLLTITDPEGHFVIPYNAPPMTIHGYPIVTTQFVAAVGAGAKAAIFGAWSQYIVPDRQALQIGRLTEIAYPDVWFQPVARYGGMSVNADAFRVQVLS